MRFGLGAWGRVRVCEICWPSLDGELVWRAAEAKADGVRGPVVAWNFAVWGGVMSLHATSEWLCFGGEEVVSDRRGMACSNEPESGQRTLPRVPSVLA